jgi:hypothetical protein
VFDSVPRCRHCGWTPGNRGKISPWIVDGCGYAFPAMHMLHQTSTKLSTRLVDSVASIHGCPPSSTTSQQSSPHPLGERMEPVRINRHHTPTSYPRPRAIFPHAYPQCLRASGGHSGAIEECLLMHTRAWLSTISGLLSTEPAGADHVCLNSLVPRLAGKIGCCPPASTCPQ